VNLARDTTVSLDHASVVEMDKTQQKQKLKNIMLDKSRCSVITEDMLNYNHFFDWNNIKILNSDSNYNKRLIFEIYTSKNNLTELIHKKTLDD